MAEVHRHRGAGHAKGARNCPGKKGRVLSCKADLDEIDPTRREWICTHTKVYDDDETATGTTGGSTGSGSGSPAGAGGPVAPPKLGMFGLPDSSYSPWSNGHQAGNATIYFRQSEAYGITPFFSTTILCNPDAPGQVTVSESTTETVQVNASIGSGAEAAVEASLGVEIGVSKTITVSQTFNGERCRSFDLNIHIKFMAYEILYVSPTESYVFGVLVPIGYLPIKTPVPPACCSVTTGALMRNIRDKSMNETGVAKHALAHSESHLAWAKGHLDVSTDYHQVLQGYQDAVESMILSGRHGVDCTEQIARVMDVADEIAAAVLRDSRDPILVPEEAASAESALVESAIGLELLVLAREHRASLPASAIGWYSLAHEYGERAVRLQRESLVMVDAAASDKAGKDKPGKGKSGDGK